MKNSQLSTVGIYCNDVGDSNTAVGIIAELEPLSSLTMKLSLWERKYCTPGNQITLEAHMLTKAIKRHAASLVKLELQLSSNKSGQTVSDSVAKGLQPLVKCKSLRDLRIYIRSNNNYISMKSILCILADIVLTCPQLERLALVGFGLSEHSLAEVLEMHPTIRDLTVDVCRTEFRKHAIRLGCILVNNQNLTRLEFMCSYTDNDPIFTGIELSTSLKKVLISNGSGKENGRLAAAALVSHPCIDFVGFYHCHEAFVNEALVGVVSGTNAVTSVHVEDGGQSSANVAGSRLLPTRINSVSGFQQPGQQQLMDKIHAREVHIAILLECSKPSNEEAASSITRMASNPIFDQNALLGVFELLTGVPHRPFHSSCSGGSGCE